MDQTIVITAALSQATAVDVNGTSPTPQMENNPETGEDPVPTTTAPDPSQTSAFMVTTLPLSETGPGSINPYN